MIAKLIRISVVAPIFAAAHAQAQGRFIFEGEATWWWEATVDHGASWTRGTLELTSDQTVVGIRSWLSFPNVEPLGFFNAIALDPTITAVGQDAIQDTVDTVVIGFNEFSPNVHYPVFGNVRKIDHVVDFLPPGQGEGWVGMGQPVNVGGTRANPIQMLNYSLTLSGRPGDRLIDGVFRQPAFSPPGHVVYIALTPFADTDYLMPLLRVEPLTIRVVPSPAALLTLFACFIPRRRRR